MLHANKMVTGDTFTKNTWMGDTGASFHMTNLADGMFDTTYINKKVEVVNSTKMTTTKIGKWRGLIEQEIWHQEKYFTYKVKLVS